MVKNNKSNHDPVYGWLTHNYGVRLIDVIKAKPKFNRYLKMPDKLFVERNRPCKIGTVLYGFRVQSYPCESVLKNAKNKKQTIRPNVSTHETTDSRLGQTTVRQKFRNEVRSRNSPSWTAASGCRVRRWSGPSTRSSRWTVGSSWWTFGTIRVRRSCGSARSPRAPWCLRTEPSRAF